MPGETPCTITVDRLEIPPSVSTLEGFCEWFGSLGEGAPRASFLAGRVHIEMTPQSYDHHQPLVDEVNSKLHRLADDLDLGEYFAAPSWIVCEEVGLSTEPDGFLVTWPRFESGAFRIEPGEHRATGAPTMAFEAVSESSASKDLVDLADLYFRAGVEEYWTADAREGKVDLRIHVRGRARFAARKPSRGWTASPVWGRSFRLQRSVNRAGRPRFTLESR